MSKRAMLTFTGSLTDGFQVMLEISEGNTAVFTEARGALPAAIELLQLLTQWQRDYYQSLRLARIVLESISVTTGTLVQVENCKKVEGKLKLALQNWLGAREFQPIDKKLRETIRPQEPVEVLLRTTERISFVRSALALLGFYRVLSPSRVSRQQSIRTDRFTPAHDRSGENFGNFGKSARNRYRNRSIGNLDTAECRCGTSGRAN